MVEIECLSCKEKSLKSAGHFNRAIKLGLNLFCNRKCAGLHKRKNIPRELKKRLKSIYDAEYRTKNKEMLKSKKRDYFQKVYKENPEKFCLIRQKKMPLHVQYCRNPEYKKKKAQYDRELRSKSYGEFAESHVLLIEIENEIKKRISNYEIRIKNGTLNKAQQRSRNGKVKRGYA